MQFIGSVGHYFAPAIKTSQKLRIMDNGVVGNKGSHPQNNVQQIYIFYLSRLRCWCSSPSIKIIVMKAIIILVVLGGGAGCGRRNAGDRVHCRGCRHHRYHHHHQIDHWLTLTNKKFL